MATRRKVAASNPKAKAAPVITFKAPETITIKSDGNVLEFVEILPKNTKNKWSENKYVYKYTLSSAKIGMLCPFWQSDLESLIRKELVEVK
jgi:hypothetical protein